MVAVLPFFGDSRKKLVEGLVDIFVNKVQGEGKSVWVSLEAPSGWGKTRVGKRFYAELAARQEDPRYWPATLGEASNEERKAVVPLGERESGSLPEFLWWGVSCSSDRGHRAGAFRDSLSQLESQGRYVSIACSKRQRMDEKAIEALKNQYWEFTQNGVMEVASQAVSALGAAFPGMGLAVLAAKKTAGAVRRKRSDRRLLAEQSELGASTEGLVAELVEELIEIGRAGFPIVVFVEDVHFADDALLETIDGLLRRGSHLLLVTTTWPGEIDNNENLAALVRDLDDRIVRVHHDRPAGLPFADGAGLMELEDDACRQIVLHRYPKADPETVALLVDRYRNPYALELICDMRHFKRKYGEQGNLRISPKEVAALPLKTVDLYRAYWDQLPEELRLRYAVAAVITPASINADAGGGYHTWSSPVLNDIIDGLDLPKVTELKEAFEASTDAYGWVTHVDEYLRRWSETDQGHIASEDGNNLLVDHMFVNARTEVLEALAEIVLSGAKPRPHAARTIISLRAEGFIKDDGPVAEAVAVVVDDLGYDETSTQERIRLYDLYLDLDTTDVDAETDLKVRSNGAEALATSDRHVRAADAYRDLHAQAQQALGPDHPDTLETFTSYATSVYYASRYPEAITAFEQACANLERVLGPDHPDTWKAQIAYGDALETEGRANESIDVFNQVLESRITILGDNHEDTSYMRWRLSRALESAGRNDEAIPIIQELLNNLKLEGLLRIVAKDTNDAKRALGEIDFALDTAGLGSEFIFKLEQLVRERFEQFGVDHLKTIDARYWLADALELTARDNEVEGLLEQVIADRSRLLGEDHPETIDARRSLADYLWRSDRDDEVESLFARALADSIRVFGAEDYKTIETRKRFATFYLVKNRLEEAEEMYREVYAQSCRVLGEDHPDTISSLNRIGVVLEEATRYEEARKIYQEVVAKSGMVSGDDDEWTREYRKFLAGILKKTGQIDKYIYELWQIYQGISNRLGKYHPETVDYLGYLAICLKSVGRDDEAIATQDQIIEHLTQARGKVHPDTLVQRRTKGILYLEQGRYQEAIAIAEEVLEDEVRVRGEGHFQTLSTRRLIGSALAGLGRVDDAIAVLENLLADSTKALGEHDFMTTLVREELAELRNAAN